MQGWLWLLLIALGFFDSSLAQSSSYSLTVHHFDCVRSVVEVSSPKIFAARHSCNFPLCACAFRAASYERTTAQFFEVLRMDLQSEQLGFEG